MRRLYPLVLLALLPAAHAAAPRARPDVPAETKARAKERHERVAQRRRGVAILCHRGASEFAHENTLEAYRAALELGADGNEIDIRATRDGVLVCFHDDMLDRLLKAYGDVGDYTWDELRRFPFREPGPFGKACRIPTLVEVFELHRRHAGLLHLDIKRPGLDRAIAGLLDSLDMWDHVAHVNPDTGGVILKSPRFKPRTYKGGLYLDHAEVDPKAIAATLKKRGDDVIVDDPRGVLVALRRRLGKVSTKPVDPAVAVTPKGGEKPPPVRELLRTLREADGWDRVARSARARRESGERIVARARAAESLGEAGERSPEVFAALEERVRKRSLHREWMFHGLDGAMALRSLIELRAPRAVAVARFALWRDDPALAKVVDPRFKVPRAWADFRVKAVAFPALRALPGADTQKLCTDYLALTDEEARRIGPEQFEEAARTLLAVRPRAETALGLMKHRLRVVRGRAVLECLRRVKEPWAREALKNGAPHALAYVPPGGK
jgi:hypothetical protein